MTFGPYRRGTKVSIMETKETMGLTTDEISIKTETERVGEVGLGIDPSYCLSHVTEGTRRKSSTRGRQQANDKGRKGEKEQGTEERTKRGGEGGGGLSPYALIECGATEVNSACSFYPKR